ncbi:hypothetical protein SAMN04488137_2244 [Fictibacillus solisalsi]|uniref:Uncharacterized protein n=1 Tax=Fictibacillus solisalsi TaxID=459525 RepID=A0A1G9WL17_9BACL|nr:hypothetical protein [Fictibacillus solisalsi]SDM85234.1 hypothetical protein SAMN04488137_2244 [Fictibacillus solisalsi]
MDKKKPILSPLIAFFIIIGVWIGAGLQSDDEHAQHNSKSDAKVYYKL